MADEKDDADEETREVDEKLEAERRERRDKRDKVLRNLPGTSKAQLFVWPGEQKLEEMDGQFATQEYIQILIRKDPSDITAICKLPNGHDKNVWILEHLRIFLSEMNLLTVFLAEECTADTCPLMVATKDWEFLCAAHPKEPRKCSAIDYTIHTLSGFNALLNSDQFPSRVRVAAKSTKFFSSIARRLYRLFAHPYYHHRAIFDSFEAFQHMHTSFDSSAAFGTPGQRANGMMTFFDDGYQTPTEAQHLSIDPVESERVIKEPSLASPDCGTPATPPFVRAMSREVHTPRFSTEDMRRRDFRLKEPQSGRGSPRGPLSPQLADCAMRTDELRSPDSSPSERHRLRKHQERDSDYQPRDDGDLSDDLDLSDDGQWSRPRTRERDSSPGVYLPSNKTRGEGKRPSKARVSRQSIALPNAKPKRMRNKRRKIEEIAENELWTCPRGCGKIYKRTSTLSIRKHTSQICVAKMVKKGRQSQTTGSSSSSQSSSSGSPPSPTTSPMSSPAATPDTTPDSSPVGPGEPARFQGLVPKSSSSSASISASPSMTMNVDHDGLKTAATTAATTATTATTAVPVAIHKLAAAAAALTSSPAFAAAMATLSASAQAQMQQLMPLPPPAISSMSSSTSSKMEFEPTPTPTPTHAHPPSSAPAFGFGSSRCAGLFPSSSTSTSTSMAMSISRSGTPELPTSSDELRPSSLIIIPDMFGAHRDDERRKRSPFKEDAHRDAMMLAPGPFPSPSNAVIMEAHDQVFNSFSVHAFSSPAHALRKRGTFEEFAWPAHG